MAEKTIRVVPLVELETSIGSFPAGEECGLPLRYAQRKIEDGSCVLPENYLKPKAQPAPAPLPEDKPETGKHEGGKK